MIKDATDLTPKQIAAIKRQLQVANARLIEERIRSNELDLGVVGVHRMAAGEECLVTGLDDELVLIVSPRHRWARRRTVGPAALASEPLLMREEGSATRDVMMRALLQAGVRYQTAMELDHTEAIKQAVRANVGLSVMSRRAVDEECRSGVLGCLRVANLAIARSFYLATHKERSRSPLGEAFRAFVEAEAS